MSVQYGKSQKLYLENVYFQLECPLLICKLAALCSQVEALQKVLVTNSCSVWFLYTLLFNESLIFLLCFRSANNI
jgi:hypothetical protein